jgi:hypothetical protein
LTAARIVAGARCARAFTADRVVRSAARATSGVPWRRWLVVAAAKKCAWHQQQDAVCEHPEALRLHGARIVMENSKQFYETAQRALCERNQVAFQRGSHFSTF